MPYVLSFFFFFFRQVHSASGGILRPCRIYDTMEVELLPPNQRIRRVIYEHKTTFCLTSQYIVNVVKDSLRIAVFIRRGTDHSV